MDDLTISKVKTGKGLAGSRIALIFAPSDAPPGSMVSLTRFLNAQPHLRAIPGYHGPGKNHVLRISGLKNDAHFLQLLQKDFPTWQAQQEEQPTHSLRIASNIQCEPINEVDHFPHQPLIQRIVKENANSLSGVAYIVGNMGLLYSAMRQSRTTANQDWFKLYSSLSYNIGSASLLVLGNRNDNPRDVYTIMEELYPKLQNAEAEHKEHVHNTIERTIAFMRNHPWEISSAINATGAASHIVSTQLRRRKGANVTFEALSAMGTLTAMTIAALVPEKEGRDIADLSNVFEREAKDSMLGTMDEMRANRGLLSQMQESPLAISAGIQAISNTGYGISALQRKPLDPGLLTMSASYLTGNAIQSQATKGRGPGFDDIVTAAAAVLRSDPAMADKSPEEVDAHIARFAEALSEEHEVVHKKRRMAHAIKARLKRYDLPREEENHLLTGFVESEKQVLQHSPFLQNSHVQSVMASNANTEDSLAL